MTAVLHFQSLAMQCVCCALRCRSAPSGWRREWASTGFDDWDRRRASPMRCVFLAKVLVREIPFSGQTIPCSAKKIPCSEKNRESPAASSNRWTILCQPAPKTALNKPSFAKFPVIFPVLRENPPSRVSLDIGLPNDLLPPRDLGSDHMGKFRGRVRHRHEAERRQSLLHVGRRQRGDDAPIDEIDDLARRAC